MLLRRFNARRKGQLKKFVYHLLRLLASAWSPSKYLHNHLYNVLTVRYYSLSRNFFPFIGWRKNYGSLRTLNMLKDLAARRRRLKWSDS